MIHRSLSQSFSPGLRERFEGWEVGDCDWDVQTDKRTPKNINTDRLGSGSVGRPSG